MSSTQRLRGKVAIVTGSSGGLGRAEALELGRAGASVIVNGTTGEGVADALREIRAAGGEAIGAVASVAGMDGAKHIVDTALQQYGRIDILVNNAGNLRTGRIDQMSEEDFDATIAVHLKGTFNMTRLVSPLLCAQRSGVVINTSSSSGLGHYGKSAYAAAKEAIVGFTRSVARDLGPFGVRCVALRPGGKSRQSGEANTVALAREAEEKYGFPAIGDSWMSSWTKPADAVHVGRFVVWLCTDAAHNLNGRTLRIRGGLVGIYSEPVLEHSGMRDAGWDFDALDDPAIQRELFGDATNRFAPRAPAADS
jgi:NAD(P)-dependent dehydrogenase (short-subunit alcohol dehydrogenase family)